MGPETTASFRTGFTIMTETAHLPRLALVQAGWYRDLLDNARTSFLEEMERNGVPAKRIDIIDAPGAFEIPLLVKELAETHRYDGVVALGMIIDAGVYRHEFVAHAVIDGLMRVQLDTGVPVFSMVLTPHHMHGHADHLDFFGTHFLAKGAECARACLKTIQTLRSIRTPDH